MPLDKLEVPVELDHLEVLVNPELEDNPEPEDNLELEVQEDNQVQVNQDLDQDSLQQTPMVVIPQ